MNTRGIYMYIHVNHPAYSLNGCTFIVYIVEYNVNRMYILCYFYDT